jgi:hypothetical protein
MKQKGLKTIPCTKNSPEGFILLQLKHLQMKRNIFFLTISIIATMYSCTEPYPVELDGSYPRLVVDGAITTDTARHLVKLSKSAAYFINQPQEGVQNALVSISDGTQNFSLLEDPQNPGNYYTDPNVYGIPGRTYTLTINNVDINNDNVFETYTASCLLNPSNKLDSIRIEFIHKFYQDHYQVSVFGQDPSEIKDIYMYRIRINGNLITDTITEVKFADDEFFNGSYVVNQPVYYLSPTKNDELLKEGDTIVLEQYGITKEYLDFITEILAESHGADPFGGQPANILTNVEDKNMSYGYFGAFSITRTNYIVNKKDLVLK